MSLIYTMILTGLKVSTWVAWKRASRSERKWEALTKEAENLHATWKSPAGKVDELTRIAAYHQTGATVAKRDRQAARAARKADRAERLEKATAAVSEWKGKGIPYAAGAIDSVLGVTLLQVFQPWVVERLVPLVTAWAERLRDAV